MKVFDNARTVNSSVAVLSLLILLTLVLGSVTSSQAAEQSPIVRKLSGGMSVNQWVGTFSPDGKQMVFLDRQGLELYSVATDGLSPPVRIVELVPGMEYSIRYQITPDSSQVVFAASLGMVYKWELYSVPISGGPVTKLSGSLVDGGHVYFDFLISPDNSRAVYQADQDEDEVLELYSVPLLGGPVTQLNGTLVEGGGVIQGAFVISPDGKRVVYSADQDIEDLVELYSVPIEGGPVTKLNGPRVNTMSFEMEFVISPDSKWVVYRTDPQGDGIHELYSVPIIGGQATKLNGALLPGGSVNDFVISPDSTRVVFRAPQEEIDASEPGLYSVPINGGTMTKLSDPILRWGYPFRYAISPGSKRVVFAAEPKGRIQGVGYALYTVPAEGGPIMKLSDDAAGGLNDKILAAISPDGQRVVYWTDQEENGVNELHSVPIVGGQITKLNPPLVKDGDVVSYDFLISADSGRVYYRADQEQDETFELYSVPIVGGPTTKLNEVLVGGGDVFEFAVGAFHNRVVYSADQEVDEKYELFAVQDDPRPNLTINKQFEGLHHAAEWNFVGTDPIGQFTLSDALGYVKSFELLEPGEYTIGELRPEGYATSVQCTDSSAKTGDASVTLNLEMGSDVWCTFTNNRLANVTIQQSVDGDPPTADWQFSGDLGTFTLPAAGGETSFEDIPSGYHRISTVQVAGYYPSVRCFETESGLDVDIRVGLGLIEFDHDGVDLTCQFTSTSQKGTDLTIETIVVGDAPQKDWEYAYVRNASSEYTSGDFVIFNLPAAGDKVTFESVAPGRYEIEERTSTGAIPGYIRQSSCSDGSVGSRFISTQMELGQAITCTFTNTQMSKVTITKQVVGEAPQNRWRFSGGDYIGEFELPAAGGSSTFDLPPGSHTLRELSYEGYLPSVACTDGTTGIDAVDLELGIGEEIECTFTNTPDAEETGKTYLPFVMR